jgi:hypothetical protein
VSGPSASPSPRAPGRRGFRRGPPLLGALFAFFTLWAAFHATLNLDTSVRKLDDGSQYLLVAKGLAQGKGFANLSLPGLPDFLDLPSAFPLMLMPYWWLPTPPVLALHLLMALLISAGAWLAFLWLRGLIPQGQAFLIALAFASAPWFVLLASTVHTEAPYVFLLYAGLLISAREARTWAEGRGSARSPEGWLALFCWLVLFRLRINTMPFLAVHLFVLMRRGRTERPRWMAGILLALAWLALERLFRTPDSGGYLQFDLGRRLALDAGPLGMAGTFLREAGRNLYSFFGSVYGDLMAPWFYGLVPMNPAKRAGVLALSAWGLFGFGLLWKRHPDLRPYLAGFLLSWAPFFLQRSVALGRYMFPSFPLLAACLAVPFSPAAPRFAYGKVLAPALLSILLAAQALQTHLRGDFRSIEPERMAYHRIHAYIRAASPRPEAVLSPFRFATHLETGVPALGYPDQWENALRLGKLTGRERIWVILPSPPDRSDRWDLGEGFRPGPEPLFHHEGISLFEVRAGPAEARP